MLAERIRKKLDKKKIPHENSSIGDHVTLSFGIGSVIPDKIVKPESLIKLADTALYVAKGNGRNCIEINN